MLIIHALQLLAVDTFGLPVTAGIMLALIALILAGLILAGCTRRAPRPGPHPGETSGDSPCA